MTATRRTPRASQSPITMNNDSPNIRPDLIFDYYLPDHDYRRLSPGEELMIMNFNGNRRRLLGQMQRWGKQHGLRYRITQLRNRTYIKCLKRQPPRRLQARLLADVPKRRAPADRSSWRRNGETGEYWCEDFAAGIRWTIRRDAADPVLPWAIFRAGALVARARTIYAAKQTAADLG